MEALRAAMFEPMPDIKDRFPDLDGALLLKEIVKTYATIKQPTILHWFLKDGRPAFVPHPLNDRRQRAVQLKYARSILKNGIMDGVRQVSKSRVKSCDTI